MEQEATGEFLCFQSHRLFLIPVSSFSVHQRHFAILDLKGTVLRKRRPVGVGAEVVENSVRRPAGLFGIDHPRCFFRNALRLSLCGFDFSFLASRL